MPHKRVVSMVTASVGGAITFFEAWLTQPTRRVHIMIMTCSCSICDVFLPLVHVIYFISIRLVDWKCAPRVSSAFSSISVAFRRCDVVGEAYRS